MLMIRELLAHNSNYTAMTSRDIKYIVIHYTANDGDTAEGNCKYFNAANRKASGSLFCRRAGNMAQRQRQGRGMALRRENLLS